MVIEGFDFGPYVTKLIIAWNGETDNLSAEDFSIEATRQGGAFEQDEIIDGNRKVTCVSVSGNKLTLELEVHPSIAVANAFCVEKKEDGPGKFYLGNQWAYPYTHSLKWKGTEHIMERTDVIMPLADSFDISGRFTATDGVTLQYASFIPAEAEYSRRPLIIWLHGAGEGSWFGTQPASIAIIGNKVVAFADKGIQDIMGGAYILAPQVPTMWMDDGTGAYTKDGTTMYENALHQLIERYLTDHPNVDTDRIYIGGCSNGGFMTMRMVLSFPELFAAAFPVCQAYKPEWITDEQLKRIIDLPIWQVHAKNDAIVPFTGAEEVYERLIKGGAKNAHYTWYDSMEDKSGLWCDDTGKPWTYDGHWSWIHVYNNDANATVDGVDISLFEWLAKQHR
jgi:predicted peptidase